MLIHNTGIQCHFAITVWQSAITNALIFGISFRNLDTGFHRIGWLYNATTGVITANVTKPMSAYIAGVTAPAGKKMGHAGAIVSGGKGTAQGKMDALAAAGVSVGRNPTEAGELMAGLVAAL